MSQVLINFDTNRLATEVLFARHVDDDDDDMSHCRNIVDLEQNFRKLDVAYLRTVAINNRRLRQSFASSYNPSRPPSHSLSEIARPSLADQEQVNKEANLFCTVDRIVDYRIKPLNPSASSAKYGGARKSSRRRH